MKRSSAARGASLWSEVSAELALNEAPHPSPCALPIGQRRRRGYDAAGTDGRAQVELIRDVEGVLRWVYTPPLAGFPPDGAPTARSRLRRATWWSDSASTNSVATR